MAAEFPTSRELRRPAYDRSRTATALRRALPGIPTIRLFEALACGIPLVCAPWDTARAVLARPDFLVARDGEA